MIKRQPTIIKEIILMPIGILLCAISTSNIAGTLYKWIDENGAVRYSDQLPPEQIRQRHQMLNDQGVVVGTKEAAKTKEQLAVEAEAKKALEAQQAEEKRLKDAQDKKDRVLLLTFSSESEMESVRDNRIEVIESVIRLIKKSIAATEERLIVLEDSADENYLSKGKDVPGGLAQNIEHFTAKLANRKGQLRQKELEKQKIDQQFDLDLARYRFLKSESESGPRHEK